MMQVDMITGSDLMGTANKKGDSYFEKPRIAMDGAFNAGEHTLSTRSSQASCAPCCGFLMKCLSENPQLLPVVRRRLPDTAFIELRFLILARRILRRTDAPLVYRHLDTVYHFIDLQHRPLPSGAQAGRLRITCSCDACRLV